MYGVGGDDEFLGERAVAIDAEHLGVQAPVGHRAAAHGAATARDQRHDRDPLAWVEVADLSGDLGDGARERMAVRQRVWGGAQPTCDVDVGATEADSRRHQADLTGSREVGGGDVADADVGAVFLQRAHGGFLRWGSGL